MKRQTRNHTHPMGQRVISWIRSHLSIRIVLPTVVTLGLLAYVSDVASSRKSGDQIWVVIQQTWYWVFILTIPYLAARALVWHELLQALGLRVPLRPLLTAFAGGEMTKSLPGGIYLENYLLSRLVHFGQVSTIRSSMATTAMLGLESALAVPAVLIIGVPGWRPWLFWTILGLVLFWALLLAVAWLIVRRWEANLKPGAHALLRRVLMSVAEFLEAGGDLMSLRTLQALVPTAAYMLVYVIDLYIIIRAIGVQQVSFVDTIAIYAFVVLAVVLIPIPTELGITEFSGLNALIAYGVPKSTAAIIMLSLRILATGMTILVAGGILFLLRDELARAGEQEGTQDTSVPAR
jgi:uncharacterized membrane protein YbhN (UPF0104 family)